MYLFLYLIYFLTALSLVGLILVGLGGFFDWGLWGLNHPTFALLVTVIFLATEVLVMFFFVGTGVSVKEYVRDRGGDPEWHRKSVALKRVLYPPTLLATVAVMVQFILGGAVGQQLIATWWHLIGWVMALGLFLRAIVIQHQCFKENTAIILGMVGLQLTQQQQDGAS